MGTTPTVEMPPCVGLKPRIPQLAAGMRMLPAVSVPTSDSRQKKEAPGRALRCAERRRPAQEGD